MPTFFNPGGRTLAGGDMMPFVIPCPKADAARIRINASICLLRTADPFVGVVAFAPPGLAFYFALTQRLRAGLMNSALAGCCRDIAQFPIAPESLRSRHAFAGIRAGAGLGAGAGVRAGADLRAASGGSALRWASLFGCIGYAGRFWNHRQPALGHEIHGLLDRDAHDAGLLVNPVVTLQSLVLVFEFLDELRPFAVFEDGFGERLVDLLLNLARRHDIRIHAGLDRHGICRRLMAPIIAVEEAIHSHQDEIDRDPDDSEPAEEVEHTEWAEILVFEALGRALPGIEVLFTHAWAPELASRRRRRRVGAATNSNCGRSKRARDRPSRTGSADRPR